MRVWAAAAILAAWVPVSSFAQSATAVGTGIATSRSSSQALAISGQGGTGVGSVSNNPNVSATINSTSSVPANQNIRNVPTVFSPGLTAAGIETCLGSISGGGGWLGTGFSFGTTIPDPGCQSRLDARTLWSFGLKKAAVARLCLSIDIYNSMPEVCAQYLPRPQMDAYAAQATLASTTDAPINTPQVIELIDGRTGRIRMCDNYDSKLFKCWHWRDDTRTKRVVARAPKGVAVGNGAAANIPKEGPL